MLQAIKIDMTPSLIPQQLLLIDMQVRKLLQSVMMQGALGMLAICITAHVSTPAPRAVQPGGGSCLAKAGTTGKATSRASPTALA